MSLEADEEVRDRVRAAFVDAEPLTVAEVAVGADVPEPVTADVLEALAADGELRRSEVRGVDIRQRKEAEDADVDLEAPVELFHRPPVDLSGGPGVDDVDDQECRDAVDRRLARMDVPGASEMMRDWRRDAVRGTYEYLQSDGPCEPAELREAVYPAHEAGFDDPQDWWEFVRPRLARLPGVTTTERAWTLED